MTPALAPAIPEPRLRTVENRTPFVMFQCDKMGPGRRFYDTVVVKGTFALAPGKLVMAERQSPIALADEYWDAEASERSSVKRAGDAILGKPGADVMITGTARPLEGRPRADWEVAVLVKGRGGTVIDYGARVTGPRHLRHRALRGWVVSDPEPATEVPIRYELAYGGAFLDERQGEAQPRWVFHPENPSGTGFFDEAAMSTEATYRAPQWEPLGAPFQAVNREVPLTGLGPVARWWRSRQRHAGTYDETWLEATRRDVQNGLPADYAGDFDARFFQAAHPSLVAREPLAGDEHIGLAGVSREHAELVLKLPGISVAARLFDGRGGRVEHALSLDTVHLDLDAARVHLCWRLTLSQERDIRAAVITTGEVR